VSGLFVPLTICTATIRTMDCSHTIDRSYTRLYFVVIVNFFFRDYIGLCILFSILTSSQRVCPVYTCVVCDLIQLCRYWRVKLSSSPSSSPCRWRCMHDVGTAYAEPARRRYVAIHGRLHELWKRYDNKETSLKKFLGDASPVYSPAA